MRCMHMLSGSVRLRLVHGKTSSVHLCAARTWLDVPFQFPSNGFSLSLLLLPCSARREKGSHASGCWLMVRE